MTMETNLVLSILLNIFLLGACISALIFTYRNGRDHLKYLERLQLIINDILKSEDSRK